MSAHRVVWRWITTAVVATACWTLSGCALPRMIDTDVQSFTGATSIPAGATYRFEHLPSQEVLASQYDTLQTWAQNSLERVGLVRDDVQARYSVQVELGITQFYPEPRLPMIHQRPWRGADGKIFYPPGSMLNLPESPWYSYTVHLLMREVATAQVAYETTANFQGPWRDGGNLVPIVMDAALQGFPTPPAGPRKVLTELIPREAATP